MSEVELQLKEFIHEDQGDGWVDIDTHHKKAITQLPFKIILESVALQGRLELAITGGIAKVVAWHCHTGASARKQTTLN